MRSLQAVEGDVLLEREGLAGLRVLVEQPFDDAVADDAGLDDLGDVLGLEARVEEALGAHDDDRALLAEAVAAGLDDLDLVAEAARRELLVERLAQGDAARGVTGGAGADADLGLVVAGEVGGLVEGLLEGVVDAARALVGGRRRRRFARPFCAPWPPAPAGALAVAARLRAGS